MINQLILKSISSLFKNENNCSGLDSNFEKLKTNSSQKNVNAVTVRIGIRQCCTCVGAFTCVRTGICFRDNVKANEVV